MSLQCLQLLLHDLVYNFDLTTSYRSAMPKIFTFRPLDNFTDPWFRLQTSGVRAITNGHLCFGSVYCRGPQHDIVQPGISVLVFLKNILPPAPTITTSHHNTKTTIKVFVAITFVSADNFK